MDYVVNAVPGINRQVWETAERVEVKKNSPCPSWVTFHLRGVVQEKHPLNFE